VPAFVIVDMAVVSMMLLVAQAPAVVGDKDERVKRMSHKVIHLANAIITAAAAATARHGNE
jgi:hypothetical protein